MQLTSGKFELCDIPNSFATADSGGKPKRIRQ
jgi:hypothetical protein